MCLSVTLQHYETRVGGVRHKGRKEKKANAEAERDKTRVSMAETTVMEGSKRGSAGATGRRCWRVAATSGVVEIFQQRASLLLSNVHLVLQVLGTSRHQRDSNYQGNHHTQGDTFVTKMG